tara:strand:- start:409 stop:1053 length:645 start_codon:yes stop_codon:yes gene_type:complete
MSKTSKTAYYYPSKSAKSTGESPSEKVNTAINNSEKKNNAIINLTEGKISSIDKMTFLEQFRNREKNLSSYYNMSNKSNGRTLNVPKVLAPGMVPNASYNGAVTIGEKCEGPHCAIPVVPTSGYMINQNLRSANPPKAALQMYPSTFRLGNNSDVNPGITKYVNGTRVNPGPFNIEVPAKAHQFQFIVNPMDGNKVPVNSHEGRQILENYKNFN